MTAEQFKGFKPTALMRVQSRPASSYKEFDRRDQFDDLASDLGRRGRQGLGAVDQRQRFRIERGDARNSPRCDAPAHNRRA